jgi:2-hydroxy-3-oxopropionate reductase
MKIGFIGLGIMGKPMAKNLLKAGHEVVCYDVVKENVENVVAAGAKAGKSAADVAGQVPLVITMLPNSPHVKSVVMGEGGVLEGAKEGLILIDMSSIAPLASQEVEKACASKKVRMLDAPVSGGEPKAVDGTLAIMVGGQEELFEEVRDILLVMGCSAVHCGPIGAGNTTKLANQVIVALNIANALDTGHGVGSPLPLTALAREMMETLHADGFGSDDHSALARYYAKLSGTAIGQ